MAACETLSKTLSYHAEPRPELGKSLHDAIIFTSRYILNEQLGQGAFGTVFSGVRIDDERSVAVKFVARSKVLKWSMVSGFEALLMHVVLQLNGHRVPREIALLAHCRDQSIEGVIQLLDWYERHDAFIIVMQRPANCQVRKR